MVWQEELALACAGARRVVLLGVGSELCGDDAAGMLLAENVSRRLGQGSGWQILAGSTAPENFTGPIRAFKPDVFIVADAADFGAEVGHARLIDPEAMEEAGFSTHMLPFRLTLDYLKQDLGCEVFILGIQAGAMEFATPASPQLRRAVEEIGEYLAQLLSEKIFTYKRD